MTTPQHLKITGPEDVLGYIPHSLGYWPVNSLVAMTVQGKRLGATLRVDLPGNGTGADPVTGAAPGRGAAEYARTVASYLAADKQADGVLLAFFTAGSIRGGDDDEHSGGGEAGSSGGADSGGGADADGGSRVREEAEVAGDLRNGLLAALETVLAGAGLPVRDAWIIGARVWRSAYCSDPACCDPHGRPVAEIRNSCLSVEMVFRGSAVGPAPGATGLLLPPADPVALEAERDWARQFQGLQRNQAQFGRVMDVWTRVLSAASGQELPPALAGYLRASLCVQVWRDAVLVMAAAGREAAERGAAGFGSFDRPARRNNTPGADLPWPPLSGFAEVPGSSGAADTCHTPGYGEVLLGLAPAIPDWTRMTKLDQVLAELVTDSGPEARAANLTGRGWIQWCRGRGSIADALYRQAGQECPGYRLAELLAELAVRGTLCGWAARPESAWQKIEPDAA